MRIIAWPARAICAAALVTGALAGCSAPSTPPPTRTAAPAAAPVSAAGPGAESIGSPAVVEPASSVTPAQNAPAPSAGAAARLSTPTAGGPSVAAAPRVGSITAALPPASAVVPASAAAVPPAPVFTEVTAPAGTTLAIELRTSHASDTSHGEDSVRGVLRRPLVVDGVELAPAGTAVTGQVTAAERAGKVKGLARLVLRFSSIVVDESDTAISTSAISREGRATKKTDAAKIGIGAGAGAVIGAIAGGRKGAVVGGAVGAGAGTGVVLATRGDEVVLTAGTAVTTTLSRPLVVRVRVP